MSVQEDIRRLDAEGVSQREIARRLKVSRESVAKYSGLQDCSPQPVVAHTRPGGSVLTGFETTIDGWLADDARRPRKQRHTAKRVFDRLVTEEGFTGSYSPVQRYVKRWQARNRAAGEGFAELVWAPGTVQVDFGQAEAVIAGVRQVLHVLVVTFPFSNMRFAQVFRGESAECICHGLRTIFEHIGGAARQMVFDNATGAGRRTGKIVVESKLFAAFKLHYRSQARYCNPYSGHEKGNVENAVGFLRRNLMVPEPETTSLQALNQVLLARCDALAGAEHWRKGVTVRELFAQDVAACLALPGIGFDPVRYERRTADKHGNIPVEGNTYAAGPSFGSRRLRVGLRHDTVEILDEHAEPVIVFARAFGRNTETVIDPVRLVPLLIRKPGAWENSLLRAHVPDPLRDWLDAAESPDRRRMLTAVHTTTGGAGFQATLSAAEALIRRGDDPSAPALGMLARRIAQGEPVTVPEVDLGVYDTLVARMGQSA